MKKPEERKVGWDTLVEKYGLEGAKEEMRRRSLLVKNRDKAGFKDPAKAREAQRLSVEAKKRKKELNATNKTNKIMVP